MSQYLDFSQEVRGSIESSPTLMEMLHKHYETQNGSALELIGQGSMNSIYRVGQLESGIWVALREIRASKRYGVTNTYLNMYESYCQEAERLAENGARVSKFCVGLVCGHGASILIEDLTVGGQRKIKGEMEKREARYEDTGEAVYTDIDDTNAEFEEFRFMGEETRINLSPSPLSK